MPFDTAAFTEYTSDARYDLLKKPVKVDKDNRAYEIQFIPPATAQGTYSATDTTVNINQACWNSDGSLHYMDVYCGSDYKANMAGTFLVMKYKVAQIRTSDQAAVFLGPPIAPTQVNGTGVGTSIPWNPMYFFNTVALKLNQSQTPVEQYINAGQLHHITTARYLQKYKRSALEGNDMSFFTPCIESKYDNDTISAESANRSYNWCGANGAVDARPGAVGSPIEYQKVIPFSDIFECCENPGIWTNCSRFRFEFTMKLPSAVGFKCGAQAGTGGLYVFVTEVKIMFDSTRMQAMQTIETATEKQKGTVENIAYYENFVIPVTYAPGSQLVATGQRDVQQLIVGFPAMGLTLDGSACVNPIQYFSGALSSLSVIYGSDMPLRAPLALGNNVTANSTKLDTQAYALYRKACGADRMNVVSVPLSLSTYRQYHLYYLPIFNPLMPHRNNDPKDLRVDTQSNLAATPGVANCAAVLIIRKFAGTQVDSTGAVERL